MSSWVLLRRGSVVESRHRVHVAVVDRDGRLRARAGDAERMTLLRSAAKPFQALPLVGDGALTRFGIEGAELALCCASHNGEPRHLEGVRRILSRSGVREDALACGPHLPMLEAAAHDLLREGGRAERIHNNCSGKHAGMLALARHHGWPLEGYHEVGHPVQERMRSEISRRTGLEPDRIPTAVDGCGVLCFGLPLLAVARAFGRLGDAAARGEPGPHQVVSAMTGHPFHVAGTGRLCTRLMLASEGEILAKVGAEGVYGATEREGRVGLALKVEDGSRRAAEVALVRVLERLDLLSRGAAAELEEWRRKAVPNTRGEEVAFLEAHLELTPA